MAEGSSNGENSWESWLGGWVQTAKEKSNTALEFVKKDLAEFSCTVQKETENAVQKTSSSLTKANTEEATSKFKAGISSFFDNISKALVIPPDDDYIPMTVSADGNSLYDRGKARLHALQLDASTYMDPHQGPPEQYAMWMDSFDMDQHKGQISELLVSRVEIRALYTKLVPNEVSHADFWQRYFYKVHQLQCDEARKQALMKRAEQARGDSLSWEDDWSGGEDEDDDGNQSDWEKMPRPSQQPVAAAVAEKPPKSPSLPPPTCEESSQLKTAEKDIPSRPSESQPSTEQDDNGDSKNEPRVSVQPAESASNTNSSPDPANEQQPLSTPSTSSPDSTAATATASVACVDVQADEESSGGGSHLPSNPSQPLPAESLSRNVPPSETACASHHHQEAGNDMLPRIPEGDGRGSATQQSGSSSSDVHDHPHAESSNRSRQDEGNTAGQQKDIDAVSGAAAAASTMESPRPTNINMAAEGACGAAAMVDSLASPRHQEPAAEVPPTSNNRDDDSSPAAPSSFSSPALAPESASVVVPEERRASERDEVEAAAVPSSAMATAAATSKEIDSAKKGLELPIPDQNIVPSAAVVDAPAQPDVLSEQVASDSDAAVEDEVPSEIGMRVKGDMVVIGERGSPSTESSDAKDLALDEEWEQDFDVEVTEEDLKAAEDIAKKLGENLDAEDDDWENWE